MWNTPIVQPSLGGDGAGVLITGMGCSVGMTNTVLVSHTLGISVTLNNAVT